MAFGVTPVEGSFSDHIVFVDESGDHGLKTIDHSYPVFVLAFCIFAKKDYSNFVSPILTQFKFHHFGHDQVILHEADIRKDRSDFSFLKDPARKYAFMDELTRIVEQTPFTLIAVVIDKIKHKSRYSEPWNPYHLALQFGLERIAKWLQRQESSGTTHIVVEGRGKREDGELYKEFQDIFGGVGHRCDPLPFEMVFADKRSNCAGLQLADLSVRPIGLHVLRPDQQNRAFKVLEVKFDRNDGGSIDGWGLKVFPEH